MGDLDRQHILEHKCEVRVPYIVWWRSETKVWRGGEDETLPYGDCGYYILLLLFACSEALCDLLRQTHDRLVVYIWDVIGRTQLFRDEGSGDGAVVITRQPSTK